MPAFRLPRLPASQPAWKNQQLWWQRVVEQIEAQEARQDEIIAELKATVDRLRRLLSYTNPTTILNATDDGSDCTITIAPHKRVYADSTDVDVNGGAFPGLLPDTLYAVYYDDPDFAGGTPTYVVTTDLAEAQYNVDDTRHFCGIILTPVAGSGDSIDSGGSYPGGSGGVAGEVEGAF